MRVNFPKYSLVDILTERIGYEAGLLLSMQEILDLLNPLGYEDLIFSSEKKGISSGQDHQNLLINSKL